MKWIGLLVMSAHGLTLMHKREADAQVTWSKKTTQHSYGSISVGCSDHKARKSRKCQAFIR